MSRFKINSLGKEISVSAKSNWDLWKFANTLNRDEIESLITAYRKRLKETNDNTTKRKLRQDILLLTDCWKLKKLNANNSSSNIEYLLEEGRRISHVVIHSLGYKQDIYKEEIDSIFECLKQERLIATKCSKYSDETYATVVVSEILDYYGASYDDTFYKNFGVNEKDYLNLKIILNHWLTSSYWLPKL